MQKLGDEVKDKIYIKKFNFHLGNDDNDAHEIDEQIVKVLNDWTSEHVAYRHTHTYIRVKKNRKSWLTIKTRRLSFRSFPKRNKKVFHTSSSSTFTSIKVRYILHLHMSKNKRAISIKDPFRFVNFFSVWRHLHRNEPTKRENNQNLKKIPKKSISSMFTSVCCHIFRILYSHMTAKRQRNAENIWLQSRTYVYCQIFTEKNIFITIM